MSLYVIGQSRDGRGAIVRWSQKVCSKDEASEVLAKWEAAGIDGSLIIIE